MELFKTQHPFTVDRDISSAAFWSQTFLERDEAFAWLRANAPVSWHRPMDEGAMVPPDHGEAGFWALTRVEEINYASQHHELFSSALGGVVVSPAEGMPFPVATILDSDPPLHTRYRNLLSATFTPKGVASLSGKLEQRAVDIVAEVQGIGDYDFAERVSSRLPMLTFGDMFGVPESLMPEFTEAAIELIATKPADAPPPPGDVVERMMAIAGRLFEITHEIVRARREQPADDIATALAIGEIDGRRLTDDEITATTMVLAAAANDTTRHTTSWTLYNLWSNPDQKAWLEEDFDGRIGQSVEEFIRHATVVNMFARTATQEVELGGQQIAAGDKVGLFYCSGNRDESVFPDPHRFDLSRQRANHVAFGGRGVHFCLGNVLAKAQLRAIFRQILTQLPDLELLGPPVPSPHEGFNTVGHLPVRS